MNLKDIKGLIQEFDASGVHKLQLEMEEIKLTLEKESAPAAPVVPQVAPVYETIVPAVTPAPQMPVPTATQDTESKTEDGYEVKSPVVGTFYVAGAPGAKPYVTVGQLVNAGDTVCIVEAMKMMNEIQSPVTGIVKEILVQDGDMVQFDQTIMIIKE